MEERDQWVESFKRIGILQNIKTKYVFGERLGRGSFGKVYLCTRISDGKVVAIKTINKKKLSVDVKNIFLLTSEIQVMRLVNHPNAIKLHEVYESDIHVHLVLEYIQGGDLISHFIKKGVYNEHDASSLIYQALELLDYLQTYNIAHRDLKPGNLLIEYIFFI